MNLKTKTLWWSWRYVIYIIHDVFFRDYTMLSDSDCSLSNLLSFQGLCCTMNMYYETLLMLSSLTCPLDALRLSHHLPVTWFCPTSTLVPPYLNWLNGISCLLTVTFCLSVCDLPDFPVATLDCLHVAECKSAVDSTCAARFWPI